MSVRFKKSAEYLQKFDVVPPRLYMNHLSDEDYNARLLQAIEDNKPIDEEEFMPKMEYFDDGTPRIHI